MFYAHLNEDGTRDRYFWCDGMCEPTDYFYILDAYNWALRQETEKISTED